jgi:hypothetical protein
MKMIQPELKPERSKNWYWWRMLPKPVVLLIVILASGILVLTFWRVDFAVALLGVVLAAWTAYHAKVSHFLECFSRCNRAYADVNARLRKPASEEQHRNHPDIDPGATTDYFNLCAEEYLMYKMGVIPRFVWDVWQAGIHDKALDKPIQNAWGKEKEAKCDYYGFDLEQIIWEHHKAHGRECEKRDNCPLGQVIARGSSAAARQPPPRIRRPSGRLTKSAISKRHRLPGRSRLFRS